MVFLFSSFTGLPDKFFDGYCFCGADYIFGQKGMEEYIKATDSDVPIGEDGCYFIIKKSGDSHEIGVDYAGFKKIFYFYDGSTWCISNSIYDMAKHLRENGVNLSINQPQLYALKINLPIMLQINCFETVFNEIRLLPSFSALSIKDNNLYFRWRQPENSPGYIDGLQYFLDMWIRRFKTLLEDQRININLELTGGIDSRISFSLFYKARERLGAFNRKGVSIRSWTNEYWKRDFEIAQKISNYYGFTLNKENSITKNYSMDTDYSYNSWKSHNLGVFMPIVFSDDHPNALNVTINGAGGEMLRPFYPLRNPDKFASGIIRSSCQGILAKTIKTFYPGHFFKKWKADFSSTIKFLKAFNNDLHPMIMHYREFRNRMHFGRMSESKVTVSPLSSKFLDHLTMHPNKVNNRQVFFDIMESMSPGLIRFDYDKNNKRPADKNLSDLSILNAGSDLPSGKVYAEDNCFDGEKLDKNERHEKLLNDYKSSKTNDVYDLFGSKFMEKCDLAKNEAKPGEPGGFTQMPYCKYGGYITLVITAAFAFNSQA